MKTAECANMRASDHVSLTLERRAASHTYKFCRVKFSEIARDYGISEWIDGSSLAKRSSEPQRWAKNASKTKDDGLSLAKISWIGSNTTSCFSCKTRKRFRSGHFCRIVLQCLQKPWEWPLLIGQFVISSTSQTIDLSFASIFSFISEELPLAD